MGEGVNLLYLRSAYPTAAGATVAGTATQGTVPAEAQIAGQALASPAEQEISNAINIGNLGNPVVGLLVFGGMTVGIMYAMRAAGEGAEFANIKASAGNILIISLVSIGGIPLWKMIATKIKIPGFSSWVLAV